MESVIMRGRRDMKPLLLKLGVALALSFAGFLVSHLRTRLGSATNESGPDSEPTSKPPTGGGLKDELRILKSDEASAKIINGTSTTTTTTTTTTTFVGLSPTSRSSGDEEGFLLPEFTDLVAKEFEASGRDPETTSNTSTPRKPETKEGTAMEQEISHLRNLVWSLRERERNLELQLLEYYGLQEQEAAVRELENQLKINTVEAKLSSLKIESLKAENRRLQDQLSDYSRTMNELEAARTKIKLLKRKMKSDGEQVKEKIAALLRRISVLQDREQKHGRDDVEVEKLKSPKDLEDEGMNLRMVNSRLKQENSDLMRKLEAAQTLSSSVLKGPEAEVLEEAERLRQANDKLTKEIEQLRTDRCADVEELVYLRWVNACLRYELRNYQPPPGKTVARDLSKTLSPKSEEKAKQLILEYANSAGDEKSMSLMDFDSEECSSSQASTGESEDTSTDISTARNSTSGKSKFFSKLKKLVLGKGTHSTRVSSVDRTPPPSCGNSARRASVSTCSFDDVIGRDSYGSFSSCTTEELSAANRLTGMEAQSDEQHRNKDARLQSFSRSSLDFQRLRRLNLEEVKDGTSYGQNRRSVSREESPIGLSQTNLLDHEDTDSPEKVEMKKFAQVLKSSRPRLDRRSSSFSN